MPRLIVTTGNPHRFTQKYLASSYVFLESDHILQGCSVGFPWLCVVAVQFCDIFVLNLRKHRDAWSYAYHG